jgi:hypothetical protein
MSASEVAPNPFWYAKSIAALTSRDRLSMCVLVMFAHESVNQLSMMKISKAVKPGAFSVVRADSNEAAAKLFEKHPHFTIFPGDSVEIMPVLPIPGA